MNIVCMTNLNIMTDGFGLIKYKYKDNRYIYQNTKFILENWFHCNNFELTRSQISSLPWVMETPVIKIYTITTTTSPHLVSDALIPRKLI